MTFNQLVNRARANLFYDEWLAGNGMAPDSLARAAFIAAYEKGFADGFEQGQLLHTEN